jgi:pyridinium-3,5-bisthiocarboxylic acid mononucleotide nickel chelatase
MTIAFCDCFSGISGDMFLAALVDAGVPLAHLQQQLGLLALAESYTLVASETHKGALRACRVDVQIAQGTVSGHRHPSAIHDMIMASALSDKVKKDSCAIFQLLAEAEARVHGEPIEHVHFHEVGAVDSIVDIVGAAIGLEYLGIAQLYSSPLPYGSGQVQSQHGLLPLPAPATLQVAQLAHIPLSPMATDVELVTPTGAAIVGTLAVFERPPLVVSTLGVGAGKRDLAWPNIMRLIVGETSPAGNRQMVLIETNIDDMNPQVYGHVMNRLFEAGARDVYMTPIYMKKNRPGTMLSVLALREDEPRLARLILEETSTLGMRVQPVQRYEAQRKMASVTTEFGDVPVKLKILDNVIVQATPEYDVCVHLATQHAVPLVRVHSAATVAAAALLHGSAGAA